MENIDLMSIWKVFFGVPIIVGIYKYYGLYLQPIDESSSKFKSKRTAKSSLAKPLQKLRYKEINKRLSSTSLRSELYTLGLRRLLDSLDLFFEGSTTKPRPFPWSINSFDRCLLMATFYPVIAAFVGWVYSGNAGVFGQVLMLQPTTDFIFRISIAIWFFSSMFFVWKVKAESETMMIIVYLFTSEMILQMAYPDNSKMIFFYLIVAVVMLVVQFVKIRHFVSASGLGAITASTVLAFSSTATGLLSSSLAGIRVLSVFLGLVVLKEDKKSFQIVRVVMYLYLFIWIFTPNLGDENFARPIEFDGLLIGLSLFPLINAPFDFASVGLTRFFLEKSSDEKSSLHRVQYAFYDFLGAFVLLVLLCSTLVFSVEAFNFAMSRTVVNVSDIINEIQKEPFSTQYAWIYFALFSTLIPTVFHLQIWALSNISIPFSKKWRAHARSRLKLARKGDVPAKTFVQIFMTAQAIWAFCITLLAFFAVAFLIIYAMNFGEYLAKWLLNVDSFSIRIFA